MYFSEKCGICGEVLPWHEGSEQYICATEWHRFYIQKLLNTKENVISNIILKFYDPFDWVSVEYQYRGRIHISHINNYNAPSKTAHNYDFAYTTTHFIEPPLNLKAALKLVQTLRTFQ